LDSKNYDITKHLDLSLLLVLAG